MSLRQIVITVIGMIVIPTLVLAFCTEVSAGTRIVVPLATTHIVNSRDNFDYNNTNRGIGILHTTDKDLELGALYIASDSFYNKNYYLYLGHAFVRTKDSRVSLGLSWASNYELAYVIPVISIQYKWIRVQTSLPLGIIASADDYINLSLVIPLGN